MMNGSNRSRCFAWLVAPWCMLAACGTETKAPVGFERPAATALTTRPFAVVVEGCALDSWQRATLNSPAAQRVLDDVILLCGKADAQGTLVPSSPDARSTFQREVEGLRAAGYRVILGITLADQTGKYYPAAAGSAMLARSEWRDAVVSQTLELAALSDGVALALPELGNDARPSLSAFVSQLAVVLRPTKPLELFAPPSVTEPSDLPGGDAYDLTTLETLVDRVRLMTLDFSCCAGPGPTIDSGWAIDAWRRARSNAAAVPLDVSYPLYGTDFGASGQRPVTYLEARALAAFHRAPLARGPALEPHFGYRDTADAPRELWFDDTTSTLAALSAWEPPVLPPEAGVLFYGLGAEDPALWDTLGRSLP